MNLSRVFSVVVVVLLSFSCAGAPLPDPSRTAADADDMRIIRDSGSPAVQRLVGRTKAAWESGVPVQQLAAEQGLALFQVVMETYVQPVPGGGAASRPVAPVR